MNHLVTCLKCDTGLEIERTVNIAHVKQRLVHKQSFLECAGGKNEQPALPRLQVTGDETCLWVGHIVGHQMGAVCTFVAGSETLNI